VLSAAEGKRQRRALERDIAREHREKAAATLRALREALHAARAQRNAALAKVTQECRAHRLALRERAHARRVATLAELRDTYAKERAEAREACLLRKSEVHQAARDPIARARGQWEAERKYQQDLRRIEQGNRDRHRQAKRAHAEERRSESDDAVRANIPQEYLALFERVKRSIKGSSRESRTEAFLRYAEQHANEVLEALESESEKKLRDLEAKHAKAQRDLRRLPSVAPRRQYTAAELADVPF
jgi:hypothetical protein